MGEYWKPVNITKRQYVNPHDLGNGAKLGEWTSQESYTNRRVAELFASGQWEASDDVRTVSDYGGDLSGKPPVIDASDDDDNLYGLASREFENVSKPKT